MRGRASEPHEHDCGIRGSGVSWIGCVVDRCVGDREAGFGDWAFATLKRVGPRERVSGSGTLAWSG